MPRGFLIGYCLAALALASAAAGWTFHSVSRATFLSCPSGHCPDPGGREYLYALQRHIDAAPSIAAATFGVVVVLALILLGIGWAMRAMWRQVSDQA
jgi:hypothetical protein